MTVTSAILQSTHSHGIRINARIGILLALIAIIASIMIALRSQPEQHCVVSGAITVVNEATGEIIQQPDAQPTVRCFATFAEAANYGSGGALNLPPNASEEEVAQALRERPIP
jgi:Na+-translocating ferredoxin:NAD+ oxidoreductase RnfG subunit